MSKLDELKINLIIWNRTREISKATDICAWLYQELVEHGKTTNDTLKEGKIKA